MFVQEPRTDEGSWTQVLKSLYLDVLPPQSRPSYVTKENPISSNRMVCDRALVVSKSWETEGTGSFIGEPLAADLLRAVAYKRINWKPCLTTPSRLKGGFIRRRGKRKILNYDALLNYLNSTFYSQVQMKMLITCRWI